MPGVYALGSAFFICQRAKIKIPDYVYYHNVVGYLFFFPYTKQQVESFPAIPPHAPNFLYELAFDLGQVFNRGIFWYWFGRLIVPEVVQGHSGRYGNNGFKQEYVRKINPAFIGRKHLRTAVDPLGEFNLCKTEAFSYFTDFCSYTGLIHCHITAFSLDYKKKDGKI